MPKGPSHFALVKYWWRLQVHYTLRFSKHPYFSPVKIGAKVWIDQIIQLYMSSWLRLQTFSTEFLREINCIFKVNARKVYHKQFYIHPIFRNRQTFNLPSPEWVVTIPRVCCVLCYKNQGLLQPAPGMEDFCFSKCLPVPVRMNIELFVVNYSDFDFRQL